MKKKIGIIGFGNMGSAIAEQLKGNYQVSVFDKDKNKTKDLFGVEPVESVIDLLKRADTLILAVKPQDFGAVLYEIKDYAQDKLIISIAAGIPTHLIEKVLGEARIVRVMPNLPVKVGKGISCISKGKFASEKDLYLAREIFNCMGETVTIVEKKMNAATAVSGSGPGYLYDLIKDKNKEEIEEYIQNDFIPSLAASAEKIGFTREQAAILATATGSGSLFFLKKTKSSPSELKKQVASKGGTTEAGFEVLDRGGSLEEAVKAALKRAEELSKKIKFVHVG